MFLWHILTNNHNWQYGVEASDPSITSGIVYTFKIRSCACGTKQRGDVVSILYPDGALHKFASDSAKHSITGWY